MKIYMASSWKNERYYTLLPKINNMGHTVLDWRDAKSGGAFRWSDATDIPVERMTGTEYRDVVLKSDRAERGFAFDYGLMQLADCCVLLLPCGRSAHLEAGWFAGNGKRLIIHTPDFDGPDLMYKMAGHITLSDAELISVLARYL